jgi:lysophospholipase L1-like esterase
MRLSVRRTAEDRHRTGRHASRAMTTRPLFLAGQILLFTLAPCVLRAQSAPTATAGSGSATVQLEAPVLTRDAAGTVTIEGGGPDRVICYTLDGSDPQAKSGPYLAPIVLPGGGTVKARVFSQDRRVKSAAASATYEPLPGQEVLPDTLVPVTQDRSWPGYDWAKRHAEVSAAVRERHPQILFIGDSITHFFGGEVWKQNYEPLNVVNLGFGWDRTENVLWRLQHGELDDAAPKVAVVLIGTNNLEKNKDEEIAAGIRGVCDEVYNHLPKTKILLLAIFPRGEKPNPLRERLVKINKLIKLLQGRNGVTFLDFGGKFLEQDGSIAKSTMGDYLHPTQKGYQIWAEAMAPTLQKLLAE